MPAAAYRIICTIRESDHGHITHVGIGSHPFHGHLLTLPEAIAVLENGDSLYTYSPEEAKVALVYPTRCPHCGADTLRSADVAVHTE